MDDVLSVSQLCQRIQSTNSSSTGASLIGRVSICEQGSLLLHDTNDAGCAIDCRSDRFHHDLQGVLVLINEWQCIKPNNQALPSVACVEFLFQNVFRVGSDTPVYQQIRREDELAARLFHSTSPVTTESQNDNEPIHIAVQITSKSVLCGNRFFLGFNVAKTANEHGEDTSGSRWRKLIAFEGDNLIPYYHDYSIGMFYLFVNLADDPTNKNSLNFIDRRSCGYTIAKNDYSPCNNEPSLPPSLFTYTGVVTRVLDPYFGVYELDRRTVTCFFHYFNYDFRYPYRVGTQLRISTFHVVKLSPSSALVPYWEIPAEKDDDQDCHHLMIVTCVCSHIQAIAFPDVTLEQPSGAESSFAGTHYLFRECCLTLSNFPCLLEKLELRASLYQKLHQHLDAEVIELAIVDTVRFLLGRLNIGKRKNDKFGNALKDIFQHEKHCSVMGEDDSVVSSGLHRFPPLKAVTEALLASKDELEHLPFSCALVPNTQELKNVNLAQYNFRHDQGDVKTFVLGILESSNDDGRLYFVDDTYRVPIVIENINALPPLGDMYLLTKFQLIQEDLSYTHIDGEKVKLYCRYIICDRRDMLPAARVVSRTQPSVLVPPLSAGTVHHFTTTAENAQFSICMLFIKSKQPITLCLGDSNEFLLTAHANAMCYGVRNSNKNSSGNDNDDISSPIEVDLFMRSQGLRYWPLLEVGHWYALIGGTNVQFLDPAPHPNIPKEAIRTCHTIDMSGFVTAKNKPRQSLQPIFCLDSDTRILKVDMLNSSNNMNQPCSIDAGAPIILVPVTDTTKNTAAPPAPMSTPVYQITDLLRPDPDNGPAMLVITDRYFQDLINVQGVVVSKMLCGTQVAHGETYQYSEDLYRQFGVGTGQAGRTILIRLRQVDGLDTFDVYMDMSSRPYPLGIIPGTQVTFYGLVRRKHGGGGVYGQAMVSTTVEVNRSLNPSIDQRGAFAHDLIPIRPLGAVKGEMVRSMIHTVFRADCTIQGITRVSLKWICTLCGTVVSHNQCYNFCRQARRIFVAEATVDVSDGTAEAMVFLESEAHVIKLLKLRPNAVAALKEAALEEGNLAYDCWMTDNQQNEPIPPSTNAPGTKTLEDLCRDQINHPFKIYGKVMPRKKRTHKNDGTVLGELKMSSTHVNNEVNDPFLTATTPQLRIKAIEFEPLEPADAAWSILHKFDTKEK